jgi:hypothetical protein
VARTLSALEARQSMGACPLEELINAPGVVDAAPDRAVCNRERRCISERDAQRKQLDL